MSVPGWYADPGGQPGMFRYWDGSAWSAALSTSQQATPPSTVAGGPAAAGEPSGGPPAVAFEPRSGGRGWLIAAGAIVVVLVMVVAFIVRGVTGPGGVFGGGGDRPAADQPLCPDQDLQPPTEEAVRGGRVHGGRLSYPLLPAPWGPPDHETRIPFGFNAWEQNILVDSYVVNGRSQGWVASVMVGELRAGDGFFSPQAGSEIVTTCIVGSFYGDAKVVRNDTVGRAIQVDGHDGWVLETELSFKIPGLRTDGEWLAVVIVDTGDGRSSIFSSSIPNTSPQWEAPARQAMADLRVDG